MGFLSAGSMRFSAPTTRVRPLSLVGLGRQNLSSFVGTLMDLSICGIIFGYWTDHGGCVGWYRSSSRKR